MAQAKDKLDDAAAVEAKIKELPAFGDVAARLHQVILQANPELQPRLWYGMPGYAAAKSKPVLCFFRVDDDKYVTLGLSEHARHAPDEGADDQLMASAWFLTGLDDATERRIAEIVTRATR